METTPEINTNKREDDRIMDVIKKKQMKMRPHWYFLARAVFAIIVAVMLFLLLLYVVSFIIFTLDQNGAWSAAYLGPSGWSILFAALPWGLLLFSLVLLLLLAILLKRYTFVYHQPVFYLLVASVIVFTFGGFFLAATSFHTGLAQYAENNIPVLGNIYTYETALPANVHRGEIVAFINNGFLIENEFGVTSTVTVATGTAFIGNLNVGDIVLVFGPRQGDGMIVAFGIQRTAAATSTGVLVH